MEEYGGISLLREYIESWEGCTPVSADGTKYQIVIDPIAGTRAVGHGIDLDAGGYATDLAAAGQPTEVGAWVDKEFLDKLKEQIIGDHLQRVRALVAGLNLKEYQIHALVTFSYNLGSVDSDFVPTYQNTWVEERDNLFDGTTTEPNFNHGLFQNWWGLYVNAGGGYVQGLMNRRKSEWTLFQTGYYDTLKRWYTAGGNFNNADGSVDEEAIRQFQVELGKKIGHEAEVANLGFGLNDATYSVSSSKVLAAGNPAYTTLAYSRSGGLWFQCTWWAHCRASEYLTERYGCSLSAIDHNWGNGADFWETNISYGYFAYGKEPRDHSIIVWGGGQAPYYGCGHVAFVEAIDTVNNYMYISQAGSGTHFYGITRLGLHDQYIWTPDWYLKGFIYLDEPTGFGK